MMLDAFVNDCRNDFLENFPFGIVVASEGGFKLKQALNLTL